MASRGSKANGGSDGGEKRQRGQFAVQRRQLTVMFCDLVGSTELATRIDPEELNELLIAYLAGCTRWIEAAGGVVARYMGDGVLAYFGHPEAHEDDVERALYAALSIRDGVPALTTLLDEPLQVRVGVATGMAVVGDLISSNAVEEQIVVGETPNLAARLQAMAAPQTVVVSDNVRRLASALFEFDDLGLLPLRGFSHPEPAWRLTGVRDAPERFRARQRGDLPPMVGCEAELGLIMQRWRACLHQGIQLVTIEGEPGVGKSRLLQEMRQAVAGNSHVWLEAGGARIFANTPLHAARQLARRLLVYTPTITGEGAWTRLTRALAEADVHVEAAPALLAELLGLERFTQAPPLKLTPDVRRRRLLDALCAWFLNTARRRPTILVLEDLQWIDPSTIEWLELALTRAGRSPLLVVCTSREAGAARLSLPATEIRLRRLGEAEMTRLVNNLWKLPQPTVKDIVHRSGGVPFFAEELARLVVEQRGRSGELRIPSSLSDTLTARLDALGAARDLAHIASILGDEVQPELLADLAGVDPADLVEALGLMERADILARTAAPDGPRYVFRHALLRDAAYEGMLKKQRRALHRRTADLLLSRHSSLLAGRIEVLAHHWSGAGEWDEAANAWREAGQSAVARRAYHEAERAFAEAIAALTALPETAERDLRELELQSASERVLQITRGYSAPAAIVATTRARRLAEKGGDLAARIIHATGAWMAVSSSGHYQQANRLADQILPLALAEGGDTALGMAYMAQVTTRYRMGDLTGAEEAFHSGEAAFMTPEFRHQPGAPAQTFGNAAVLAWIRGDLAAARSRNAMALGHSRENGTPYDRAFGAYMTAMHHLMMGESEQAAAFADEAQALSDEHGFPQFLAISRIVLGRARAGREPAAASLMLEGLEAMRAARSRAGLTMYVTWLAEARAVEGDRAGARRAIRNALRLNPHERFFRPESLRVQAALRRADGEYAAAEQDVRQALALAHAIGASLFYERARADLFQAKSTWPGDL